MADKQKLRKPPQQQMAPIIQDESEHSEKNLNLMTHEDFNKKYTVESLISAKRSTPREALNSENTFENCINE